MNAAVYCTRLFTLAQSDSEELVKLKAIYFLGVQGLMKSLKKIGASLAGFGNGASLGGKVSHYKNKQNIYKQGTPAFTLFYIQEGGVRLSMRSKNQTSAVTAILGVNDFFGELCLAGYPLGCPRRWL